jgi:predicted nucleic acid-binding protein
MTGGEPLFLDTNVLVAASDESRLSHVECVELLERGFEGKRALRISGQVQREYLVVATRPVGVNGLGMLPGRALENVERFLLAAQVLEETLGATDQLLKFVRRYRLAGKRIHDANLVAVAGEHGIGCLVTLNPADFSCFESLRVISPEAALKGGAIKG